MASKLKERIILSPYGRPLVYLKQLINFHNSKYEIEPTIKKFLGEDVSESRKKELAKHMKEAWLKYQWDFNEFFLFDYEHSDSKKRKSFVSAYEKTHFCQFVNDPRETGKLKNKWKTYNIFKKYYNRDACHITCADDLNSSEFSEFITKHNDFIIKPTSQCQGTGIQVIHAKNADDAIAQMKNVMHKSKTSYIIEELVIQSKDTAVFHPTSVNTLRVPTIQVGDRVEILTPMFRTGRGGSVVDNAGAGGVLGNVDINIGKIYAACDEFGHQYMVHPDTNIPIVGFTIPRLKEALDLAVELTKMLPGITFASWDLALTDNGWVVIEGNSKGALGFQYAAKKGFREQFNKIIRDYIKASK